MQWVYVLCLVINYFRFERSNIMALTSNVSPTKVNGSSTPAKKDEEKKPVKLVKKEAPVFDETGCFTSPLIQFDFFKKRKFADILRNECYYISAAFTHESLIFGDKEREYLGDRLEFYFNHAKSLMVETKDKLSKANVLEKLLSEENGQEKALKYLETLKEIGSEEIEITYEPISFLEAKAMVLKNFSDHCQMFLEQLKEVSTRY